MRARLAGPYPCSLPRSRGQRLPLVAAALACVLSATPGPAAPGPATRATGASEGAAAGAPSRIVSLAPSLTEILYAVGAGGSVVGVTSVCDHPPAAAALPAVGGMEDGAIDFERILGLEPDLVVSIGLGQEGAVAALRRLGLRVEVVPSQTVDDVFAAVRQVGDLAGRPGDGERLARELEARVGRVRQAVAEVPAGRRPRVFFEIWDQPLMTANRQTLIGQLIRLAGGVNVFGGLPARYPQVSVEAVVSRDPEVIVAPDYHDEAVYLGSLTRRPGLRQVEAVRRGRVVILDGDLVSRPGPRVAEALELLAHHLHPDLLPPPEAEPGGGGR